MTDEKLNELAQNLCTDAGKFLVEALNSLDPAKRGEVVQDVANGFRLVVYVQAAPPPFTVRVNLLKFGDKPDTTEVKPIFTCIVPEAQVPPMTVN